MTGLAYHFVIVLRSPIPLLAHRENKGGCLSFVLLRKVRKERFLLCGRDSWRLLYSPSSIANGISVEDICVLLAVLVTRRLGLHPLVSCWMDLQSLEHWLSTQRHVEPVLQCTQLLCPSPTCNTKYSAYGVKFWIKVGVLPIPFFSLVLTSICFGQE